MDESRHFCCRNNFVLDAGSIDLCDVVAEKKKEEAGNTCTKM